MYFYIDIKILLVTSLEDILNFFSKMVATLKNQMLSTDREYSPLYNSFFFVMAVDRPSILIVPCTMTSIECNDSEIIMKINYYKKLYIYV